MSEVIEQRDELTQYHGMLAGLDWNYGFSDDGEVYRRGREAMRAVMALQPRVDPDWTIFRSFDRR